MMLWWCWCWRCFVTRLVMFLQVLLIVTDSCCQNSHWGRRQREKWSQHTIKILFILRSYFCVSLRTLCTTHHALPLSCGHSHPSGLLQPAVPSSAVASHSEDMNTEHSASCTSTFSNRLISAVLFLFLFFLDIINYWKWQSNLLWYESLHDLLTPVKEVFWQHHQSCKTRKTSI